MIRGALVVAVYNKILTLKATSEELPSAMTLMSTDVELVAAGMIELHDIWAGLVGTIIGCTILGTMGKPQVRMGKAVYLLLD
jgi:hypothetical protein